MSDEIQVRAGLTIRSGNVDYSSRPSSFRTDQEGTAKGPTPGAIAIATTGTEIVLTELTTPGWAFFRNDSVDENNYIEVGVYEPATLTFYPLFELLPGECCTMRLSRNLNEEYVGTGTSAPTNKMYARAYASGAVLLAEVFEK